MEKSFKLLPPAMPDFISYEGPAGKRPAGFDSGRNTIAVEEFTEDEAKEYAELMRNTFMQHWAQKKKEAENAG